MQGFDFSGRTVFVAGGTSGINLGIAEAFAEAGAKLAVISRSQERVDQAQKRLRRFGGEAVGFSADVRNVEAVAAALQATHQALGEIDILVSGAAGNFPSPALAMSSNGFKAVVDIDLLGTFNVLRSAHHYLRKPGATVVNISAPQALLPMAAASPCLRRQGRRRHAHPGARDRMGRRRHPREFRSCPDDRGYRRHGPAGADGGG